MAASHSTLQVITRQVKRLSDTDVYALTLSGNRAVRNLADKEAHRRAETYALENS